MVLPAVRQARDHRPLSSQVLDAEEERLDELMVVGIDEVSPAASDQGALGAATEDRGHPDGKVDRVVRPHLDQQIGAREGEA
jgi:hypothetical protein